MSVRDAAVSALLTAVAGAVPWAIVERNADAPSEISDAGHVVVRDGEPGEPDVTLGLRSYWWTHRADVEVYSINDDRHLALDRMLMAIDAALDADRTLGGAVCFTDWRIEHLEDEAADGAETVRAALVAVTMEYQTLTPMG